MLESIYPNVYTKDYNAQIFHKKVINLGKKECKYFFCQAGSPWETSRPSIPPNPTKTLKIARSLDAQFHPTKRSTIRGVHAPTSIGPLGYYFI